MTGKMVVKELFGKVKIYRLHTRVDNRGSLAYVFDESIDDFKARETRIYSMPKEGTFFGIHYRDERAPMTKFVTVIKGRGMDYVIDLRKESPTYLEWESIELSEENALAVLIPAGFGHAFISLQNNTIQLYSVDRSGDGAHSKQILVERILISYTNALNACLRVHFQKRRCSGVLNSQCKICPLAYFECLLDALCASGIVLFA